MYERILQEINPQDRAQALRILQFLAYATRRITISELAEVMAITPEEEPYFDPGQRFENKDDVPKILPAGLITTVASDDSGEKCKTVQLAHYSVLEYLISIRARSPQLSWVRFSETATHNTNAELCMAYFLHVGYKAHPLSLGLYTKLRKDFPLLDYVAQSWIEYLRKLEGRPRTDLVRRLTELMLIHNSTQWKLWLYIGGQRSVDDIMNSSEITEQDPIMPYDQIHPLSWVCTRGLVNLAQGLLKKFKVDLEEQHALWGNPLYATACSGQLATMKMLLDADADVNKHGGPLGTALHAACYVQDETSEAYETSEASIRMLLDAGADLNSVSALYGTPLVTVICAPSSSSKSKFVSLLLGLGADVNVSPRVGESWHPPLVTASMYGSVEIFLILLSAGADINMADRIYGNPLQAAISSGNAKLVSLLLESGASVKPGGEKYGGPLQAAAYHNSLEVIQLLLGNRMDVNESTHESPKNKVPLQIAVSRASWDAILMLVEAGADLSIWPREKIQQFLTHINFDPRNSKGYYQPKWKEATLAPERHKNITMRLERKLQDIAAKQEVFVSMQSI